MKGVRVSVLLLIFALTFSVSSIHVNAQTPDVTILPKQTVVSVDSSFIVKVDPKTTEKPIRMVWSIYDMGNEGLGSFPIVDGKGVCYFSNDDENATCGPSPFTQTGETDLYVYVITPTKITNTTERLNVSSLEIPMGGVQKEDNTVYMYFYMEERDLMTYTIYKEDLTIYQSNRPISYDATEGRYEGNITLNAGVYYFAFVVNDNDVTGTALKRIYIPSEDFLTISTDKNEYWTGEKITIAGTTNADSVTGQINFPNGTKAKDFSADVAGDNTFSYEFYSKSNWPEGDYEIKTTSPLSKSVEFSIVEFFELTPESVSVVINKSDDFEKTIQLKNLRNETNVSLSTTGGMKDEYVTIGDTVLSPQETTTITISITNVGANIQGTIKITTPAGLELSVPVSITALEEGECPPCIPSDGGKALEIDEDSLVWSQECKVDDEISYSIVISNNGDSILSGFDYEVRDVFTTENSLEDLDSYEYIIIPVQDFSVDPGESEYLDISITPSYAGRHQGLITFTSNDDSASIFVDLNCFTDITGDLESLSEDLNELNPIEDVFNDISSDIEYAQNAFDYGNYQQASEYYEKARAKIGVLEKGGVSQPMDLTWMIIIIIIVVVVLVVVWFFKFKKPQISEYEEETESLEGFE